MVTKKELESRIVNLEGAISSLRREIEFLKRQPRSSVKPIVPSLPTGETPCIVCGITGWHACIGQQVGIPYTPLWAEGNQRGFPATGMG